MQYELLIGNIDLLKESGCCADESKLLFSAGVLNDSPVRNMEDKMRIHRLVWIGVIILTPMGISGVESRAQAPLPPTSTAPSVQSSSATQSVVTQLQALAAQISSLNQDLTSLMQQLQQLRASKPNPVPNDAVSPCAVA